MGWIRNWRRKRILRRSALPDAAWTAAYQRVPLLQGLSPGERQRLHELATVFLAEKVIETAQDLELLLVDRLVIALQACLPVLALDLDWYDGWSSVIVYPGQFRPHREDMDEHGIVHVCHEPMSGESWVRGPVILSWADVLASGQCVGHNVIIHELAHKLDMLNGEANGFPPLHRSMSVTSWSGAFTDAFEDMGRRIDAGEDPLIDVYAAEDPAECFAVFSEYFFELPRLLATQYPLVYEQLVKFYRQDPGQRLSAPAHSL